MEVKDTSKILQIAVAVVSLFNFNDMQEKRLNNYVKSNMYQWIENRKHDSEIEELIKSEARRIE